MLYHHLAQPRGKFGRRLLQFLIWANAPMNRLTITCLKPTRRDQVRQIEALFTNAGFSHIQTIARRSLRNGAFYCTQGFAS
jgi:hypothetical protein